jgi:HemY protein
MIRVLLYLLLLGAVMVGVAWVAAQPGTVTIVWQDWRVDTTVGVLAAAVAGAAIVAALLFRFWTTIVTAPRRLARWRRERRQRAGYAALSAGLIAVAAGDPAGARREAKRADRLLGAPPLTLLLTAQAAQLTGDEETAQHHFTAMLEQPQTEFLGLRGLMARALRDRNFPRALELAKRARGLRPRAPWVLTTLLDLQTRQGDWAGAADTLAQMAKAKIVAAAELRRHEATVQLELSRAAATDSRAADSLRHAKRAYRADPDHPAVVPWLAERYVASGRQRRAAKLIEHAWTRQPHPDLLAAYRKAHGSTTTLAWANEVQHLAGLAPAHSESHRALGEAALEAGLWGEARKHFTAAITAAGAAPPAIFCRKLALVEERDKGDVAAAQRWLALAAEGHPDATWICDSCGAVHAAWRPVCGRCGSFDRLTWRLPDRAVPLVATATTARRSAVTDRSAPPG